jgi:glycosyltransferase involved in cell wall biosynthesis
MTISVVIPTYQRVDFLKECIESVLAQTLLPDEIIIGDDSNDFDTEVMIAEFRLVSSVPVRYYHHKPSLKQTKNVDFLFKKVECDLLLLLHDDDLLFPNCFELLKKPLEDYPEVLASFGNQVFIDENSNYIKGSDSVNEVYFRTPERVGLIDGFTAGVVSMFPNNGFLIRRKEALLVGYYDNGKAGDAVDFYFGYCLGKLRRQFVYVNEFTAKYRVSSVSVSNSATNDATYSVIKILMEDLSSNDISSEIQQSIENRMPIAITLAINLKDRKNALKWILSPYYRKKIFTARGVKRILLLMVSIFK